MRSRQLREVSEIEKFEKNSAVRKESTTNRILSRCHISELYFTLLI